MCTNKRWIRNKYNKQSYFVSCGHCAACQMEKANKVAQKIRNNNSSDFITLFVHLTYSNSCIPYIRKTDLLKGLIDTPIYRDSINRRKRVNESYAFTKCREKKVVQIGSFHFLDIPDNVDSIISLPSPTHIDDTDKVGVIFNSDIQNFIKRLRAYVRYNKNTYQQFDFSWFQLAEYGETFSRPHFHLLFRIPKSSSVELWKSAISENWPFDDYNTTYRKIEIAIRAANYVSSYVNRPATIPPFFYQKELSPTRSHSLHFGQALDEFSLPEICKKIDLRNLTYDCFGIRKDGTFGNTTVSIPYYVVNRYFPKIKGLFRLAPHEVRDVISLAETFVRVEREFGIENLVNCNLDFSCFNHYNVLHLIQLLKVRCEYELEDYRLNLLRLAHAKQYFDEYFHYHGIYNLNYDFYYNEVSKLRFKRLMELQYSKDTYQLQQYDNLFQVNFSAIPTFINKAFVVVDGSAYFYPDLEKDPNNFYENINKTLNYKKLFYNRDKQHKFNNQLYMMRKYGKY